MKKSGHKKSNGAELFYQSVGEGSETILFSHGFLLDHSMFDGPINSLKNTFRCVAYDHRGHGNSEVTKEGYALDNLVKDAIALIESFAVGPVHFVGMSTGGFVAMRVALKRPDLIKSLVLMDTSAEAEASKAVKRYQLLLWMVKYVGMWSVVNKVMPIMFHQSFLKDKSRKAEVNKWRHIVTGQNKQAMVSFGQGIFARKSVLQQLNALQMPVAVIVGEHDMATPPIHAQRMHEAISQSKIYTIANAGHSAAIETPSSVTDAMIDFYATINTHD